MGYERYTSRQWKVIASDDAAKCTPDDIVTFGGESGEVNIRCKRYVDGKYQDKPGEPQEPGKIIVGDDEYEIEMLVGTEVPRIKLTPVPKHAGSIAGSWTAEDHGPWQGDG